MEEVDPSYTDDEYEARVIAQYCNKPENYEDLLRSQNHNPKKYGTVPRPRKKKAKRFSPSESSSQESPEYQEETSECKESSTEAEQSEEDQVSQGEISE